MNQSQKRTKIASIPCKPRMAEDIEVEANIGGRKFNTILNAER